jgi:GNAT superfamily N-acetyltransferase
MPLPSDYSISSDPSRLDLQAIHAFLSQAYWSREVPMEVVRRAIENSIAFGVFWKGEQVGFARVISDRATFAYLADVYVLEAHRGKGLAKELMKVILAHPDLQGLRRLMLATADAHGLYEQFGFKPLATPERFMEIHVANAYLRQSENPKSEQNLPPGRGPGV